MNFQSPSPDQEQIEYWKIKYDGKTRFISYWYQINEVIKHAPNTVLIVGDKTNFVSNYLKNVGIDTVTLDKKINENINIS